MVKKILAVLLAVLMTASILAACGGATEKGSETTTTGTAETTAATTSGSENTGIDMSKKLTISWLGAPYFATGEKDTWIQQNLEERFNVEIDPIIFPNDGWAQKIPAMLAGGNIPDVMLMGVVDGVTQYARQGILAEVPYSILKKYAPNIVAYKEKLGNYAWMTTYYDGKNYGFNNFWGDGQYPGTSVWRLDWLKKVGIDKVPETIDEMHDAFAKFKEAGLGYGMSGDMKYYVDCFGEIFGAYGSVPFSWVLKDNNIVYDGLESGAKDAITLLNKWYGEGLIHPNFVTDYGGYGDYTTPEESEFINGEVGYLGGYGVFTDLWSTVMDPDNPASRMYLMKQLDPNVELAFSIPPKGPTGKSGRYISGKYDGSGGQPIAFGKQVENDPDKMARILTIYDAMFSDPQLYIETKIGEKGVMWDYIDPSMGAASSFKMLSPYDTTDMQLKNLILPNLGGGGFFNPFAFESTYENSYCSSVSQATKDLMMKYRKPDFAITGIRLSHLPSETQYMADLQNLQLAEYTKMIRGDVPLSDWNKFVNDFNSKGGTQLTQEANEAYKNLAQLIDKFNTELGK